MFTSKRKARRLGVIAVVASLPDLELGYNQAAGRKYHIRRPIVRYTVKKIRCRAIPDSQVNRRTYTRLSRNKKQSAMKTQLPSCVM
jgi:hypothetical protein